MGCVQGSIIRALQTDGQRGAEMGSKTVSTAAPQKQTSKSTERGENSYMAKYIGYKVCAAQQKTGSSKVFAHPQC